MSGGHYEYGGEEMPRPGEGESNICLNLIIVTNLASVNQEVLSRAKEGDILPVAAQSADGPVVVLKDGEILGTVLSRQLMTLLNCMNAGTDYKAVVAKIEDAICQVKISAVK